jgi:hypothetical protein
LILINAKHRQRRLNSRGAGWEAKMVDRNVNRAFLRAYRNNIMRYQKLLKSHKTDFERDYIKERLSACNAAVKALSEPDRQLRD